MNYKYKSTSIEFFVNYKLANLCAFDEYYYFESDELIEEATQISEEEFKVILDRIEIFEPEEIVPQPTQLDRIEEMVSKSQAEIAQEARDAYTLELIEGGVIA